MAGRTKMYSSRNAVTSVMRRMGIKREDYGRFIKKMGSKQFVFYCLDAKESLEKVEEEIKITPAPRFAPVFGKSCIVAPKKTHPRRRRPKALVVSDKKTPRKSITQTCKTLILEGWSDEEIFKVLQRDFGTKDHQKWYPSWNRCAMRRNRELPPAVDPLRQDKMATHIVED